MRNLVTAFDLALLVVNPGWTKEEARVNMNQIEVALAEHLENLEEFAIEWLYTKELLSYIWSSYPLNLDHLSGIHRLWERLLNQLFKLQKFEAKVFETIKLKQNILPQYLDNVENGEEIKKAWLGLLGGSLPSRIPNIAKNAIASLPRDDFDESSLEIEYDGSNESVPICLNNNDWENWAVELLEEFRWERYCPVPVDVFDVKTEKGGQGMAAVREKFVRKVQCLKPLNLIKKIMTTAAPSGMRNFDVPVKLKDDSFEEGKNDKTWSFEVWFSIPNKYPVRARIYSNAKSEIQARYVWYTIKKTFEEQ